MTKQSSWWHKNVTNWIQKRHMHQAINRFECLSNEMYNRRIRSKWLVNKNFKDFQYFAFRFILAKKIKIVC